MTAEATTGNVKVTRQDWLEAALDILVGDGISEVKVLTLSARLGVSRSSFYWYFESREDLHAALLDHWEATNTGILLRHLNQPAGSITEATCNFFLCLLDPGGFDYQLDFAIREWARRDEAVHLRVAAGDEARLSAFREMFLRFGYPPADADIRARVIYFQQIGYYALDLRESVDTRLSRVADYTRAFTGVTPPATEIEQFARKVWSRLSKNA